MFNRAMRFPGRYLILGMLAFSVPAQAIERLKHDVDHSIVTHITALESSSLDANELLKKSDSARGGNVEGLAFNAALTSYKDEKKVNSFSMLIEAAGDDNLVSFTEPARSKGLKILVRARNMWFLSPSTKRPVPISPRQRLLGEANNGDIATTNYSRDYDAEIIGEAKVNSVDCYVLWLNAKASNVTYKQVRYYIAKGSHLALKSDFFTASDKMLKSAMMSYGNKIVFPDRELQFIDEMKVYDAVNKSNVTVMKYFDVEAKSIPASRFDRRLLMQG